MLDMAHNGGEAGWEGGCNSCMIGATYVGPMFKLTTDTFAAQEATVQSNVAKTHLVCWPVQAFNPPWQAQAGARHSLACLPGWLVTQGW